MRSRNRLTSQPSVPVLSNSAETPNSTAPRPATSPAARTPGTRTGRLGHHHESGEITRPDRRSGTVRLTADRAGTADLRPGHSQADRLSSRIPPHVMALAAHLPKMRRMQGRSPGPFVPGGRAPAGMWLRDGVTSSERAGRAARRLVPAPWRRSPPPTAASRAAQHGGRPRSLFVLLPHCWPYRLHFTGMSCGPGIQRDPGIGPSVPMIGLCSATLAAAGRHGQPVRRAGPRRHRVLPYHPRPDVHAVLAEAGVRNVGGNHPHRDDDIPRAQIRLWKRSRTGRGPRRR